MGKSFNVLIYLKAGTLFIVSKIENFINKDMQQGMALMIITNQGKEIASDIYHTLDRTVTLMEGNGLISGEKIVLYCVVTRIKVPTLQKIVSNDDYSTFMAISDVSEIIGKHIKSNASKLDKQ